MNLSIKNFFFLIGSIILAILLSAFFAIYSLTSSSRALDTLYSDRHEMIIYSNILRQSSNDLTKFARLYVVNRDEKYKNAYLDILDIRNGLKARPLGYEGVYWDLSESERSKRHPPTKKKELNSILKELPFDNYERTKLQEAQNNSDTLANLEIEAFNAIVGLYKDENGNYSRYAEKNQQKAIELLHSEDYLKAKERIMLPIDEFLEHLTKRFDENISKIEENNKLYTDILIFILSLFIFALVLFFYVIIKKILNPIIYLSDAIHGFKQSITSQIKDRIFYNDEIGYMSKQFYKMRDNIISDTKIRSIDERKIKEYLSLVDQNILTSSTDLSGKITYVSEAFSYISGYSKEELIGKSHSMVKHSDMPRKVYDELWETISKDKTWHGEIKNRTKDGGYYWVRATIYPIYDEMDKKIGYTAIRVDITNQKKVEELLESSKLNEKKIKNYVALVDKNIITSSTDIHGKITYISEAFSEISGYNKSELIGKSHSMVKHPDMPHEIYEDLWESITLNRTWHGEIKNRTKNGGFYWVDATIYPTFDESGEKIGYTAIRIDITDKKRVEELLITDGLTGIYNRRHFNDTMPRAINMAKRDGHYFSFLILDIDHFKQYNDTYGHQEGDTVLIEVAKAIKLSLRRGSDMCFRLGGEEFGVLFESQNSEEALAFANSIRENIENLKIEHKNNSASKYVTASFGLVTKKSTDTIVDDEIYKEADDYLYKAKESGRNKVEANKI